jgi:hypothetical protein
MAERASRAGRRDAHKTRGRRALARSPARAGAENVEMERRPAAPGFVEEQLCQAALLLLVPSDRLAGTAGDARIP